MSDIKSIESNFQSFKANKNQNTNLIIFQSLQKDGVVPETDLLLVLLVIFPNSAIILDSSDNHIQHQGEPAQADGGDQEDVQGEEVLDQGQLSPDQLVELNNARVSIADD